MNEIHSLLDALGDVDLRDEAIERLAALGMPAVPWLCVRLRTPDYEVCAAIVEALVRIGPAAVDRLCEMLGSKYEADRRFAAESLGRIGDPRAVVPLCGVLRSRSDSLTVVAAAALGRIGDPRANDSLCAALSNHNPRVRTAVMGALKAIGSDLADSFLTVLCRHRDVAWRDAADVLIELRDSRALVPLRMALTDISAPVRCTAAAGLGQLGDLEAVPKLCLLLRDPDGYVRDTAGSALETLALSHPAPQLRQALPYLDRLSKAEIVLPWEARTFAKAALAIRTATDALAQQPIPASAPELPAEAFPLPASPAAQSAHTLPIPGYEDGAAPAVRTRRTRWWTIFSRRRS